MEVGFNCWVQNDSHGLLTFNDPKDLTPAQEREERKRIQVEVVCQTQPGVGCLVYVHCPVTLSKILYPCLVAG